MKKPGLILLYCIGFFFAFPEAHSQSSPEIFIRRGHRKGISDIAFSKEGAVMASAGSEGEVLVWNTATGALLHRLHFGAGELNAVAISPDGRWIAGGGESKEVIVKNLATGEPHTSFSPGFLPYEITGISFSESGSLLVSCTKLGSLDLRDTRTWESVSSFDLGDDYIGDICFGPGDSILYAGLSSTGEIREVNLRTKKIRKVTSPGGLYPSLTFNPAVQKLNVSRSGSACVLDIVSGTVTDLDMSRGVCMSSSLSPDGTSLVMGYLDGALEKMDFPPDGMVHVLNSPGKSPLNIVQYSPDGEYIVTANYEGEMRLWSSGGDFLTQFEGGASPVQHIAISPDGNEILVGTSNRRVRTVHLNVLEQNLLHRLPISGDITGAALACNGKAAILAYNNAGGYIQEMQRNKKSIEFDHVQWVLESPPDSAALVMLSNGDVQWCAMQEKPVQTAWRIPRSDNPYGHLMRSGKDLFFVSHPYHGYADGGLQVAVQDRDSVIAAVVSPDEKWVAELVELRAAHPTGRHLSEFIDETVEIRIYSLPDLSLVKKFHPRAEMREEVSRFRFGFSSIAVDPKLRYIALGSRNGQVWLYHTEDFSFAGGLFGHEDEITDLCFFPEGKKLASGSRDGTLRIWDLDSKKSLASIVFSDESYAILGNTYYMSPSAGLEAIGFRKGGKEYTGEVFDLQFNVPDKIAATLSSDPVVAERFRKIRESRLAAMEQVSFKEGFALSWADAPASASVSAGQISFSVSSPNGGKGKFTVLVNNVPDAAAQPRAVENNFQFTIALNPGMNEIQVMQTDESGNRTPPLKAFVFRSGNSALPNLYVTGIAVPSFEKLAALPNTVEDIRALVKVLKTKEGVLYNKVIVDTIFAEKFTPASLQKENLKVSASRPEDISIVYFSGHGLLSDRLEYFLATHNTDPENMDNAVPYRSLEAISAAGAARARLLLVNACHGGEAAGDQKTFDAMKAFYYDTRESYGETVIAGSAARQQALGSVDSGKNTAFGFALITVLKNNSALTAGELGKKLEFELNKLTYGEQQPAVRRVNTKMNFRIW